MIIYLFHFHYEKEVTTSILVTASILAFIAFTYLHLVFLDPAKAQCLSVSQIKVECVECGVC